MLSSSKCPNCAADLVFDEGRTSCVCKFCLSTVRAEDDSRDVSRRTSRGAPHNALPNTPPNVSRSAVPHALPGAAPNVSHSMLPNTTPGAAPHASRNPAPDASDGVSPDTSRAAVKPVRQKSILLPVAVAVTTICVFAVAFLELLPRTDAQAASSRSELLAATSFSSQASVSVAAEETIRCTLGELNYEIPAGWRAEGKANSITYFPSDGGSLHIRRIIRSAYFPDTYEDDHIFETVIASLEKSQEAYRETDRHFDSLDGASAAFVSFFWEVDSGPYEGYITVILTDTHIYFINFSHPVSLRGALKEQIEPILASVKMNPEKPAASLLGGYIQAEYQQFNSPASENGLGGTLIWFSGTITEMVEAGGVYGYRVDTGEGEWLVGIGGAPEIDIDKMLSFDLVGKNVMVYATYSGFSDVFDRPSCSLRTIESDRIYVTSPGRGYVFMDFWSEDALNLAEE